MPPESAQGLPGSERPDMERFGLKEWRRMRARSEKKMDGHVKFAPGKQSDFSHLIPRNSRVDPQPKAVRRTARP
jgi:hypothetical protein